MGRELTADRVRQDIGTLARGGLEIETFCAEVDAAVAKRLPSVASCSATLDPATNLLTGGWKYGAIAGNDDFDQEWGLIEYGQPEETSFAELAHAEVPAAGVHHSTAGDVSKSTRMRDLILPNLDCADELRMVARIDGRAWGGFAWFGEEPFDEDDIAFAASISEPFAAGLRSGILAKLALKPPANPTGPAVVIVDADDEITHVTPGAQSRLDELRDAENAPTAMAIVGSLVAGARRFAAGLTDVLPRNRVPLPSGQWLVLHASPLSATEGDTDDVVLTIEEARPPEIVPLVVAAFDLTPREREVVQCVLRGLGTKQIAAELELSAHTVQDHMKSIFEKSGVRTRRELVNQVFLGQYAPRLGSELAPSGWFLEE